MESQQKNSDVQGLGLPGPLAKHTTDVRKQRIPKGVAVPCHLLCHVKTRMLLASRSLGFNTFPMWPAFRPSCQSQHFYPKRPLEEVNKWLRKGFTISKSFASYTRSWPERRLETCRSDEIGSLQQHQDASEGEGVCSRVVDRQPENLGMLGKWPDNRQTVSR